MSNERINVCYGISDKKGTYAKVLGTSICSLLENSNEQITVHIIHDGTLSVSNLEKFKKLIESYGQYARFYDVSEKWKHMLEEIEKSIQAIGTRFTIGAILRLFMGEVIEENRAIYLDADIIVNCDIKELWGKEIPASGLAAVSDIIVQKYKNKVIKMGLVDCEGYFNSGVLLIDLRKLRRLNNIVNLCAEFIVNYMPEYMDQDFLNYYFPHSAVLPDKYNCFVYFGKQQGEPKYGYIYHYANNDAGLDIDDSFNRLYCKCFAKTPWCDENFIGNLAKKINEINYEYLCFANMCAGKRRIVIGLGNGKDSISHLLLLREDEIYVPIENIDGFRMDFRKSKDIFLIFLVGSDYSVVKDRLTALGLTEGIHFFDMCDMLGWSNKSTLGYELFIGC